MREIKFRFWNKLHKEMTFEIYPDDNDSGINKTILDYQRGIWVVMQFTGLKDKNGKEIYEFDWIGYGGKDLMIYVYCKEGRLFSKSNMDTEELEVQNYDFSGYEILGNIYENPDLAKSKEN